MNCVTEIPSFPAELSLKVMRNAQRSSCCTNLRSSVTGDAFDQGQDRQLRSVV